MESTFRIEPTRLDDIPEAIADIVAELATASAKLESALAPQTARSLAAMVRIMNTYYSNLIEGNVTRPRDIEVALLSGVESQSSIPQTIEIESSLKPIFDIGSRKTDLLIEARAHAIVQAKIDRMSEGDEKVEPASEEFIKWLHSEFYLGATATMLEITGKHFYYQMVPGAWRSMHVQDVEVGNHLPPSSARVADFMRYFSEKYTLSTMGKASRILAIPAAHHRFNYIHPFPDGNGRVSRLMSHAMAQQAGIGAHGLWSISRGLARGMKNKEDYKLMMTYADMPRQGDLDGRGNLSQKALVNFTKWFLEVCLDQVKFMTEQYEISSLATRLRRCLGEYNLNPEATNLLDEALVRGQFDRGDANRITGLPERSARRVLSEVIATGLLGSDTPKGPLSLRFPMKFQNILFPSLF